MQKRKLHCYLFSVSSDQRFSSSFLFVCTPLIFFCTNSKKRNCILQKHNLFQLETAYFPSLNTAEEYQFISWPQMSADILVPKVKQMVFQDSVPELNIWYTVWCVRQLFAQLVSVLSFSEDILSRDSGECAICLEELEQGDTIARLPCLCIYHKG